MSLIAVLAILVLAMLPMAVVVLMLRGGREEASIAASAVQPLAVVPETESPLSAGMGSVASVVQTVYTPSGSRVGRADDGITRLKLRVGSGSSTKLAGWAGPGAEDRTARMMREIAVPVYVDDPDEATWSGSASVTAQSTNVPAGWEFSPVAGRQMESNFDRSGLSGPPAGLPREWTRSATHGYALTRGDSTQRRRRMLIAAGTGAALAVTYAWLR